MAAVSELREDAIGGRDVIDIELDLKTLRTFVPQDIATRYGRTAYRQRGVQNFVVPIGRRLAGHR